MRQLRILTNGVSEISAIISRLSYILFDLDMRFAGLMRGITCGEADDHWYHYSRALTQYDGECCQGINAWTAAISAFNAAEQWVELYAIGGCRSYPPRYRQSSLYLRRFQDSFDKLANADENPRATAKQLLMMFLKTIKTQEAAHELEQSIITILGCNANTQDTKGKVQSSHA